MKRFSVRALAVLAPLGVAWAVDELATSYRIGWPWFLGVLLVSLIVGLLPVQRRNHAQSTTPLAGSEPGVFIAARQMINAGSVEAEGPGSSVTIISDDLQNTGRIERRE